MFVRSGEEEASISLLVDQEVGEVHLEGGGGRGSRGRRVRGRQCG